MTDFSKLTKLPREEQEGVIRNTPEFQQVTKLLAKWKNTKEEKHLHELRNIPEIVTKYALRKYIQQRQLTKEDAEKILNLI